MQLRKEHKELITAEVQTQLAEVIDAFRPHGWRKIAFWARDWGIAGALITVMAAMLAITLGALYQSFRHVQEETEFRTRTKDKLENIDGTLTDIQAALLNLRASDSPRSVLDEMSRLGAKTFAKALPALQKVTEQPFSEVNPPQLILREVADKLLEIDQNIPDYWMTVLRFIHFASTGASPDVPPPGTRPTIRLTDVTDSGAVKWPPISHGVVLLDGGSISNLHADHSRIIFTEHPVKMVNVTFVDCVFEMPITSAPNPYIQRASRILLASDLKSASIPNL